MLTSIRHCDSKQVLATTAEKSDGPFYCPDCNDETILKKGTVIKDHFAHKPGSTCTYSGGESDEHRHCKAEIYRELLRFSSLEAQLEKSFGTVRADIYFESKRTGNQYAIEVQLSNLTVKEIIHRTSEYAKLNIYVLWLPPVDYRLMQYTFAPKLWERWLHVAYHGNVFYWIKGLQIMPIWYAKALNWWVKPTKKNCLNLTTDFTAYERPERIGKLFVPACKLLISKDAKAFADARRNADTWREMINDLALISSHS